MLEDVRTLKVVPVVHTQEETTIPYTPMVQKVSKEVWKRIEPFVKKCYEDWSGVQIFADGFAIPEKFKDPKMTVDSYKAMWIEKLSSPMSLLIKDLTDRGAVLESTEINEKEWWIEYKSILRNFIKNPLVYRRKLDGLDNRRDEFIVQNINQRLLKEGLLMIGKKHVPNLKRKDWGPDIEVSFLQW